MIENALNFKIIRFEDKFAILVNEHFGEIKWPIKKLPESIQLNNEITLGVIEGNLENLQDEKLKMLLEELIN